MSTPPDATPRHPIRVVARRTGLTPATIRAWERRYGAVEPARSEGGQRLYSDLDLERLDTLRHLTEMGRSISSVAPLDREALLTVARHCGKVLVVHEDTRTGSVGESVAAVLQEEVFEYLDAPVRVVGALDTPVPYSPPLEEAFLPGEERVERAARLLAAY